MNLQVESIDSSVHPKEQHALDSSSSAVRQDRLLNSWKVIDVHVDDAAHVALMERRDEHVPFTCVAQTGIQLDG